LPERCKPVELQHEIVTKTVDIGTDLNSYELSSIIVH